MRRPLVGIVAGYIAGVWIGYILNKNGISDFFGYLKIVGIIGILLAVTIAVHKIIRKFYNWNRTTRSYFIERNFPKAGEARCNCKSYNYGSQCNNGYFNKKEKRGFSSTKKFSPFECDHNFVSSFEHKISKTRSPQKYIIIIILFFILGVAFYFIADEKLSISQKQIEDISDLKVAIIGEVQTLDIKEYETVTRYQFILKVIETSPESSFVNGKVLVNTYSNISNPEKMVGKNIKVIGKIELPTGKRNPNTFNYALYLKTEGISAIMEVDSASDIIILNDASGIRGFLYEKKNDFLLMLENRVGTEEAGIIRALLFGDKNGIDEESLEKFQENGVIHILAVSGLHISMIYGFCVLVFGSVRKKSTCVIIFMALISYGYLADFTPSVVRAIVMIGIHVFASIRFYRYDMLTATAFSGLIILFVNPLELFSLGFQLSFGATTLLSLFIELGKRREKDRWIDAMAPVVFLQLSMIPFVAYTFNYVSLISIIANIPIVFLASVGVPLGMICFIASMLSYQLFAIISAFLEVVGKAMIEVNEILYVEGITSITLVSPPLWAVIFFYLTTFLFFCEWGLIRRVRKEYKKLVALMVGFLLISFFIGNAMTDNYKDIKYVFVDVGQGDCIHIKSPSGKNILIDGGGSLNYDVGRKTVLPYLLKNGVGKIDLAIVSHLDTDHVGGIVSLAEEGVIEKVAVYEEVDKGNESYKKINENTEVIYLSEGDKIDIEKGLNFKVLGPPAGSLSENENNNSLITMFDYEGERMLLTGDIDEDMEKILIAEHDIKSHILKIPHHGSKTGTSEPFVEKVNPRIAVIQVGENGYGHPADRVIELCLKKGIIVYRNDEDGAISFYNNGEVLVTNGV